MNAKRRILKWLMLFQPWWIVPVIIVAIMVGGVARAKAATTQAQASSTVLPTPTASSTQVDTTTTSIGTTGTVRSGQSIKLSWQATGKVAQVLVKKGDLVQKNQILAQLDPTSNLNWVSAQANLLSAQETLANLQDVAESQASAKLALIEAQAAVKDDQTSLDALSRLPSQAAIDAWKAVYLKDQANVSSAQENYDYWIAYEYLPHCAASSGSGGGSGGGSPGGGGAGDELLVEP